MATFKNPVNGYTQHVTRAGAFFGCLLFGIFYFAYKGVWKHFLISTLAAFCTLGASWFVYPFFAYECVSHSYLEKGWKQIAGGRRVASAKRVVAAMPSFDGLP
jgi:hypothetical protein